MDGVTPAGRSPSMFATPGAPVQLPQLSPNVTQALDRAIQSGDPRVFMQLAGRARLSPEQAMEYLRLSVQRTGGQPSEGAQRIGAALQQRIQAQQPQQPQPRQAPGPDQPSPAQQQSGNGLLDTLLAPFKMLGNFILRLFGLGGNDQQRPAPPAQAPDRQRTQ